MTVAELIAKLQEMPQELPVRIFNDDYDALLDIVGVGQTLHYREMVVWIANVDQGDIDKRVSH